MTDSLSLFLSKEKVKTKFLEKTSFPEKRDPLGTEF